MSSSASALMWLVSTRIRSRTMAFSAALPSAVSPIRFGIGKRKSYVRSDRNGMALTFVATPR